MGCYDTTITTDYLRTVHKKRYGVMGGWDGVTYRIWKGIHLLTMEIIVTAVCAVLVAS
jgi:hypothetical protein